MTTQEKLLEAIHAQMPGANQSDIASAVGVSLARWNNYERGKRHMDIDALIGVAELLEWPVLRTVALHACDAKCSARELRFWRIVASGKDPECLLCKSHRIQRTSKPLALH